jgi:hypothetical protein
MSDPKSYILSPGEKGYINLAFGPRWKYISSVRAFVESFCSISLDNKIKADKISLAASELLENAVKYASEDGTNIFIKMQEDGVEISVENIATPEQIEILKSELEKVNQGEPMEAFMNKVQEVAMRDDGQSRLGLARIRCDTGADLSLSVRDGNRVRMHAFFALEKIS